MPEFNAGTLLLFPATLAVAFMFWVLWNLLKQDRQIGAWMAVRRKKAAAGSRRAGLRNFPSRPAMPRA
jgi:hypothetical protein